jgi:hypothetical protein
LKHVNRQNIQKASQWCILNKKHSNLMLSEESSNHINLYKNICAPDEHCYITIIFINNLQHELITTLCSSNDATTFTNWKGSNYIFPSTSGLKNYDSVSDAEINHLLNSKCFFGRKFNRDCFDCFWKKFYINKINNSFIMR